MRHTSLRTEVRFQDASAAVCGRRQLQTTFCLFTVFTVCTHAYISLAISLIVLTASRDVFTTGRSAEVSYRSEIVVRDPTMDGSSSLNVKRRLCLI